MAAGAILSMVLKNIPWGAVVQNAPKLADGAANLWSAVKGRNRSDAEQDGVDAPAAEAMSDTERLAARLHTVEEHVRRLDEQMQASAALIKELAEQNALLVQRIELHRRRLVRLTAVAGCIAAVLLGASAYLFLR